MVKHQMLKKTFWSKASFLWTHLLVLNYIGQQAFLVCENFFCEGLFRWNCTTYLCSKICFDVCMRTLLFFRHQTVCSQASVGLFLLALFSIFSRTNFCEKKPPHVLGVFFFFFFSSTTFSQRFYFCWNYRTISFSWVDFVLSGDRCFPILFRAQVVLPTDWNLTECVIDGFQARFGCADRWVKIERHVVFLIRKPWESAKFKMMLHDLVKRWNGYLFYDIVFFNCSWTHVYYIIELYTHTLYTGCGFAPGVNFRSLRT